MTSSELSIALSRGPLRPGHECPAFRVGEDGGIQVLPLHGPDGQQWSADAFTQGFLQQPFIHDQRRHLVQAIPLTPAVKELAVRQGYDLADVSQWVPAPPWGADASAGLLGERLVFLATVARMAPAFESRENAEACETIQRLVAKDWSGYPRDRFDAEMRAYGGPGADAMVNVLTAGFCLADGVRGPCFDTDQLALWQCPPSAPDLHQRLAGGGWLPWRLRERQVELGAGDASDALRAEVEHSLAPYDDTWTAGARTCWILRNAETLQGLGQRTSALQKQVDDAAYVRGAVGQSRRRAPSTGSTKKTHRRRRRSSRSPTDAETSPPPAALRPLSAPARVAVATSPAAFRPWAWAHQRGLLGFPAPRGQTQPEVRWCDGYPALLHVDVEFPCTGLWAPRHGRSALASLAFHALRHDLSGTLTGYAAAVGEAWHAVQTAHGVGTKHALYGREMQIGRRYIGAQWVLLMTDASTPEAQRVITAYPVHENPDRAVCKPPAEAADWSAERQLAWALLGPES